MKGWLNKEKKETRKCARGDIIENRKEGRRS